MSLYGMFKTNRDYETEGVWIEYGKDTRIKIARAGGSNKTYLAAVNKMNAEYKHQIANELLEEEVAEKLLLDVFVNTVILDWEGVSDEDGNPLEFNKENVRQVMGDLPDLFRDIQRMAGTLAIFRAEALEKEAKNS